MEEMLDVIDNRDEVIGEATRAECHNDFLRHRAVQVFVFDMNGRIFVQKRTKTKDVFPGLYEASCSGHVQAGEAYSQAAVRELAEELGITHQEHELKKVAIFKLRASPENEIITQYVLQCKCVGTLQKEEVESGEFVEWNEFLERVESDPKQFTPATVAALERYEKNAAARI